MTNALLSIAWLHTHARRILGLPRACSATDLASSSCDLSSIAASASRTPELSNCEQTRAPQPRTLTRTSPTRTDFVFVFQPPASFSLRFPATIR
ncbi:hypothetical protein FPQ18DRAFT_12746 [Pyronema domesticum]|nr:hypothetical protein FPQ18DRAFT_12746 [Pyronema domesticum]